MSPKKPIGPCVMTRGQCPAHGVVHGLEAEKLRVGIENLIRAHRPITANKLQALLDTVDAGDSLVYLEHEVEIVERARKKASRR